MILGMSLSAFTTLHVVISLIGIVTGLVVAYEMLRGRGSSTWTALFLGTTVLTSVTGFSSRSLASNPRIYSVRSHSSFSPLRSPRCMPIAFPAHGEARTLPARCLLYI